MFHIPGYIFLLFKRVLFWKGHKTLILWKALFLSERIFVRFLSQSDRVPWARTAAASGVNQEAACEKKPFHTLDIETVAHKKCPAKSWQRASLKTYKKERRRERGVLKREMEGNRVSSNVGHMYLSSEWTHMRHHTNPLYTERGVKKYGCHGDYALQASVHGWCVPQTVWCAQCDREIHHSYFIYYGHNTLQNCVITHKAHKHTHPHRGTRPG